MSQNRNLLSLRNRHSDPRWHRGCLLCRRSNCRCTRGCAIATSFYAEARELLPLRASASYHDSYSLYAITHQVARSLRLGQQLLPTSATLWPRLRELFGIINAGSPPLQVATFNGGLFDPDRYPFLEKFAVGDAHLQQALDRLARVDGQFIDYRDLAERHLGTIYEGLLEFHLEPAAQIANGKLQGDDERDRWTIDLVNDKGERHATGSYYTPDYIVKYIVEQAVGPTLTAAVTGQRDDRARIEAVMGVNVLDPAMGSGHFLVEATEYIARFMVDLGLTPDERPDSSRAEQAEAAGQIGLFTDDDFRQSMSLAVGSLWLIEESTKYRYGEV